MKNIILLALLLSACGATVGRPIPIAQVQTIKKGATTRADIERMFGAPYTVSLLPDGKVMLMYMYNRSTPKTANYIPGGALVAGGIDQEMDTLQVMIVNETGIVTDFVHTSSAGEIKTGIVQ